MVSISHICTSAFLYIQRFRAFLALDIVSICITSGSLDFIWTFYVSRCICCCSDSSLSMDICMLDKFKHTPKIQLENLAQP